MQMWWRRRDVATASRCKEATFSLTGEDEAECIEGVETFKYLGRILYWSGDDWLGYFGASVRTAGYGTGWGSLSRGRGRSQ